MCFNRSRKILVIYSNSNLLRNGIHWNQLECVDGWKDMLIKSKKRFIFRSTNLIPYEKFVFFKKRPKKNQRTQKFRLWINHYQMILNHNYEQLSVDFRTQIVEIKKYSLKSFQFTQKTQENESFFIFYYTYIIAIVFCCFRLKCFPKFLPKSIFPILLY